MRLGVRSNAVAVMQGSALASGQHPVQRPLLGGGHSMACSREPDTHAQPQNRFSIHRVGTTTGATLCHNAKTKTATSTANGNLLKWTEPARPTDRRGLDARDCQGEGSPGHLREPDEGLP